MENLPLRLKKQHAMNTYIEVEIDFHTVLTVLTLALSGGEWLALLPGKETPVSIV
jgi:hypothetical protein